MTQALKMIQCRHPRLNSRIVRSWNSLEKLKQICFRSPDHPLYPLQPLLFESVSEDKMTLPELYVQTRRPNILCQETIDALANSTIVCPRQDSKLISVLLSYLTKSGFLKI
ncbi:MAG: hypothetical protein ACRC62_38175 [Microcoleus sp.]